MVQVLPAAYPSVTNVASVTSPSEELVHPNNNASDPTKVRPLVDLGIVKTLSSFDTTSRVASWLLVVTNHGPNASTTPITATDTLPTGLVYQSADGDGWACGASGQTVTCAHKGALAVNATTSITLLTRVTAAGGSTVVNVAKIVISDPVRANNTSKATLLVPSDQSLSPTGADQQIVELAVALLLLGSLLLLAGRRSSARRE